MERTLPCRSRLGQAELAERLRLLSEGKGAAHDGRRWLR
jgi:hypothetical protein